MHQPGDDTTRLLRLCCALCDGKLWGQDDQETIKQKHMEITLSSDGCEVHVWKCRMTSGAPVSDHLHNGVVPISKAIIDGARPRLWRRHFDRADITILSEDECSRMNQIPEPALRDRYLEVHVIVRKILQRYLLTPARHINISYNNGSRPM